MLKKKPLVPSSINSTGKRDNSGHVPTIMNKTGIIVVLDGPCKGNTMKTYMSSTKIDFPMYKSFENLMLGLGFASHGSANGFCLALPGSVCKIIPENSSLFYHTCSD